MGNDFVTGTPRVGTVRTATQRRITFGGQQPLLAGGKIIDGSESRDPLNTGNLDILRAGLLMGKRTANDLYAPSVIGVLAAAYDATADTTEMTVSAATAVEMVRRIGTSGTFNLTGPPAAAGTVQTVTVTYSAIDTTTGVITITALSADVDEVQTITPTVGGNVDAVQTITPSVATAADCVQTITVGGTSSGGTIKLGFRPFGNPTGAIRWTDTIAWSATEATMTASVNTALDDLLGASEVVCSAIADTANLVMVLTFSGTNADDMVQGEISVDASALTGASTVTVAMTTAGAGTITAGSYRLGITDPSGDVQWTPSIAFDGNTAAINTALDDALGVAGVVATGGPLSGPTAIVLTFSGTGYTNLPQRPVQVEWDDVAGLDDLSVVETTDGSGGIRADGTWTISAIDNSGDRKITPPIATNGNTAAIQTALDATFGASQIVAGGGPFSTPTAIVLTFSGANFDATDHALVDIDISNTLGVSDLGIVETTAGVTATGNDFIIGSFVQPTDGSETILSLINDGTGIAVTDKDNNSIDVDYAELVIGGQIVFANIVNAPTDTSLIAYVKAALRAVGQGYAFDDDFS